MMLRIQHLSAVGGAVAVFLSLASTWWVVSPGNAPTALPVRGFDAAPALSAFFVAALASYGAGLLSRGVVRRVLSALQVALSVLAGAAALAHLSDPRGSLDSLLGRFTGLTGTGAWESVDLQGPTWWVVISLTGLVLTALSGVVGALRPDAAPRGEKFSRPADEAPRAGDAVGTWDDLSRGDDPTSR